MNNYPTTGLTETFRVIESDLAFFKALLSENGYPSSKSIVALEYMISGLVGVIYMWITNSEKLEVHEIVYQLSEI